MSAARLRELGLRPNRELGQNFLVDANILGVIARAARLDSADVVLEIGGGLGVLSEHLAERVGHVHVVEVDRRLEPALRDALRDHANAQLHLADAMELELARLRPAPTKVVANLPYGIAATSLLRTIEQLDQVSLWVAMVQREVGERLAAEPGSSAYGISSVLAQAACEVRLLRRIARTVFYPTPNVDSVLVRMSRFGPPADPAVRELVRDAFAHRRKPLAGSLALARRADEGLRERARAALEAIGAPADVRAERLSAKQFVALERELAR
ncbi:MAG TPA: 16S rRNA (adenine(1518)-N(6)/adenine(1519)-N(6))-dimethyltransferase RsmA [Solirubrobacteraceae bacterium]|nr:16S rRNA (adenine(1518)-N(6)/adenine(1519)-N(6))-dimethyltransferase RsmA [Solirubrobacteraceae bacterium]